MDLRYAIQVQIVENDQSFCMYLKAYNNFYLPFLLKRDIPSLNTLSTHTKVGKKYVFKFYLIIVVLLLVRSNTVPGSDCMWKLYSCVWCVMGLGTWQQKYMFPLYTYTPCMCGYIAVHCVFWQHKRGYNIMHSLDLY